MKLKEYNAYKHLTPDELEILYLRDNGCTWNEVALKMSMSYTRVRKMYLAIKEKLK